MTRPALLAHLSLAQGGQARQNTEVRAGKARGSRDVTSDAFHHIIAHDLERVPDPKLFWRKQFGGHKSSVSDSG